MTDMGEMTDPPAGSARAFGISRTKLQHGGLLAAVLAVIGLAALAVSGASLPDGWMIGLVNLCLAAGVGFFVWRAARDRRPLLVLDDDGIWFRDWKLPKVAWRQLRSAYAQGGRLQQAVCLEVGDPEAFAAGLPDAARGQLRANRSIRLPLLLIPNGVVEASMPEILALVQAQGIAPPRGSED